MSSDVQVGNDTPATTPTIDGAARMTEADLKPGIRAMSPIFGRLRWFYLGAFFVLLSFFGSFGSEMLLSAGGLAFIGINVFFLTWIFLAPGLLARKMLQTMRALDGEIRYRFAAEGLTVVAPGSTSSLAYRTIVRWRETPECFLIYCGPNVANIIPKRAFRPQDLPGIHAFLSEQVNQPAKRSPFVRLFVLWALLVFGAMVALQLTVLR